LNREGFDHVLFAEAGEEMDAGELADATEINGEPSGREYVPMRPSCAVTVPASRSNVATTSEPLSLRNLT